MADERIRIPLLKDHHTHPLLYAAFFQGVDLSHSVAGTWDAAERRNDAVRRIRASAEQRHSGWTIAYGWNSGRFPLAKHDLDDLPPVVVFNLSLHGLIVNNAGLEVLKRQAPHLPTHLENQKWIERNLQRILGVFVKDNISSKHLQDYFQYLLKQHGVYHAEEMLLVDETEIQMFEEAGLVSRTRFWSSPDVYELLSDAAKSKVYGVKLFADGALGTRTAAIHQSYRDAGGQGMLMYETDALEEVVGRYMDRGLPIAIHAIGDRAIDQVITVAQAIGQPATQSIRMEHAQLISEPAARLAKSLGISLCMQPNFSADSVDYQDRLALDVLRRNNPFRMLIDRVGFVPGADLLFGSDGMPHGWQEGLQQSLFPKGGFAEQSLTVDEFVAGYCIEDETAGRIEIQIDQSNKQVTGQLLHLSKRCVQHG